MGFKKKKKPVSKNETTTLYICLNQNKIAMKNTGTITNQIVVRQFYDQELGIITYKEGTWFDANNKVIINIELI